jgi:hypothetical protein
LVCEDRPESEALWASDYPYFVVDDTLYGAYQSEVVGRDAYEDDACNIIPFHHAPVVTFSVVVTATQFVMLQHGCTFVGEATELPMVSVGVTFDEHGTQMVQ